MQHGDTSGDVPAIRTYWWIFQSIIDPVRLIISADHDSEPSCPHHRRDTLLKDASTNVKLARGARSHGAFCGVFISKGQKLEINPRKGNLLACCDQSAMEVILRK